MVYWPQPIDPAHGHEQQLSSKLDVLDAGLDEEGVLGLEVDNLDHLFDGFPQFNGYEIYEALGDDDLANLALIQVLFGD